MPRDVPGGAAFRPLPALAVLRGLFEYGPASGVVSWRRPEAHRNGRTDGARAGSPHRSGYRYVRIHALGSTIAEHRLAWKLYHGDDAPAAVNHVDGDKSNNQIGNLRLATRQQVGFARDVDATSTSGVKGVSWHRRRQKWQAYIYIDGRRLHLGTFEHFSEAVAARAKAERLHQGEFRRNGPA